MSDEQSISDKPFSSPNGEEVVETEPLQPAKNVPPADSSNPDQVSDYPMEELAENQTELLTQPTLFTSQNSVPRPNSWYSDEEPEFPPLPPPPPPLSSSHGNLLQLALNLQKKSSSPGPTANAVHHPNSAQQHATNLIKRAFPPSSENRFSPLADKSAVFAPDVSMISTCDSSFDASGTSEDSNEDEVLDAMSSVSTSDLNNLEDGVKEGGDSICLG